MRVVIIIQAQLLLCTAYKNLTQRGTHTKFVSFLRFAVVVFLYFDERLSTLMQWDFLLEKHNSIFFRWIYRWKEQSVATNRSIFVTLSNAFWRRETKNTSMPPTPFLKLDAQMTSIKRWSSNGANRCFVKILLLLNDNIKRDYYYCRSFNK